MKPFRELQEQLQERRASMSSRAGKAVMNRALDDHGELSKSIEQLNDYIEQSGLKSNKKVAKSLDDIGKAYSVVTNQMKELKKVIK